MSVKEKVDVANANGNEDKLPPRKLVFRTQFLRRGLPLVYDLKHAHPPAFLQQINIFIAFRFINIFDIY